MDTIIVRRETIERVSITGAAELEQKIIKHLEGSGYDVTESLMGNGRVVVCGEKSRKTEPQTINAIALDARVIGGLA